MRRQKLTIPVAIGLSLAATLAACTLLLGAPRAAAAACGDGSLDGSFATAPVSGAIGAAGEVDCYTLPGLEADDRVSIHFEPSAVVTASPRWRLRDGNGNEICGSSGSNTCSIYGAPGWTLEVADLYQGGTFSYGLAFRHLTDPQGCTALGDPPTWGFDAPRTDGALSSAAAARCYTFTRKFGEEDGSYWFRAIRTGGELNPRWTLYGPGGNQECGAYSGTGVEYRCPALAYGQYALVVEANGGGQSGSFYVTARRLTAPSGCQSSPSTTIGAEPVTGSIALAGEADCFPLTELKANDSLAIAFSATNGSNQSPRWSLIDGAGSYICDSSFNDDFASCQLSGTPGWHLIVYDQGGPGTFSYSLAVRRLTSPTGCSSLGAPAVWSFESPRLNGTIGGTLAARCYTFTRAEGEEDGAYWFRAARSSGTLTPRWAVYGPTGARECGGETWNEVRCPLQAEGQYIFLVADSSGENSGSYYATARRLTDPAGCNPLASTSFTAPPVAGDLSNGGSIDCYGIPDVDAGDTLSVGFLPSAGASPKWIVVDGNGSTICDSSYNSENAPCNLFGSPGWSLLVYDTSSGTFSYSLAVRRLTDPEGCTPLDDSVWSFTGPRVNGSIESAMGNRCYTFTRGAGDPDGEYWFRTVRTSGTIGPSWNLFGPSGQRECDGYNNEPEGDCRLLASGDFALVVRDSSVTQSGSFYLTAKRLNPPQGCSDIPSVAFGIAPVSGTLSTGGEIDCYRLTASSGDLLDFSTTGAATAFTLLNEEGIPRCHWYQSECHLTEDGQATLLMYSGTGTGTGSYRFEASCLNVPCGQSNTAVADVTPNRLGPGDFTSVVLRGRDLDLLESAKLVRNGQSFEAELAEPSADGRAIEARFDLSGASLGSWELQASFIDGTTRALPGAVTVEPQRPPRVSVELIGREAFRVNRPSTITVSVHNSGNVDGMIVPLVLSGIPEGSIVEPLFEMRQPNGDLDEPGLEDATYEQATDTVTFEDGIALPMFLPRVPAGRTMQFQFRVTAPALGASYKLRAATGQCLGNERSSSPAASSLVSTQAFELTTSCALDITQQILSLAVPFSSCFSTGFEGATLLGRALFSPLIPEIEPVGMADGASIGLSAIGCGVEASGVGMITKKIVQGAGLVANGAQLLGDCYVPGSESELPEMAVTAIDPNELVGPIGVGPQRYISGEEPFDYRILFENLPTASAPAQRVAILNQLDTAKLDPDSVLFEDIRFGSTAFELPYASHEIDERIDLRPARDLLVDVSATVSETGLIEVELQAIDPETLEPPEDPLAGFLPPNVTAPQGEGQVSYTVEPKTLASGTAVANKASIWFDDNDPIETPTWTNTIDRQPPVPTVAAVGTGTDTAEVSWAGSDDAAGVALYEVRVSRDGGPFSLWKTSDSAGSSPFVATLPGNYSFRVTARDGADNVGQSSLAGVSLQIGEPSEDPPSTSPSAQASGPAPAAAAAAVTDPREACLRATTQAFAKALQKAKKKKGKARARAMKAARAAKKKRLQRCNQS
ncbi:MAG TPA: hypothetical protein VFU11_02465 [Solirubrobacterales bacterium]|nr:hypothetical protein [Solirubrobacterales bacterium]